jgi:2-amino-4-hydroxy-6-hydroxymethyldihydropteridine diphosphokinase
MKEVILLLGSNLGNKKEQLYEAENMVAGTIGKITKKSSVYISEPWGFKHPENFFNRIVIVNTKLKALEVLATCLSIERQMGRMRKKGIYEARTIDIDLLFFGEEIIHCKDLIVPHPQLHLRKFTLEPLCELVPDMIHPVLKKSLFQLLSICTDSSWVKRIPDEESL